MRPIVVTILYKKGRKAWCNAFGAEKDLTRLGEILGEPVKPAEGVKPCHLDLNERKRERALQLGAWSEEDL